jgi:hypothetical protein
MASAPADGEGPVSIVEPSLPTSEIARVPLVDHDKHQTAASRRERSFIEREPNNEVRFLCAIPIHAGGSLTPLGSGRSPQPKS